MTRRRFDLWNALGWLMVAVAVVLAAAGYVALLVHQPVATGLVTSYGLVALGTWWLTGRNLRAELEAVRQRLATYNASETHEALAEARSGEFEVEPFMADSGYQPPPPADPRPCSECGTAAAFCAQLVLSRDGLAGCCGACATTGTTHPALLDPRLIHLVAERTALNEWADRIHADDDPAGSLPRPLPGNGGNQ